jgi:hypothetical protein
MLSGRFGMCRAFCQQARHESRGRNSQTNHEPHPDSTRAEVELESGKI